jgi:membrane fusion protein (multidrug efflux system)
LTFVKPGQSVAIRIDTYPDHRWSGRVVSISPASGAEFSILPAQNASGNWVKVVQRITVRIAFDAQRSADTPALRSGMSTTVTIDTGCNRWQRLLHVD